MALVDVLDEIPSGHGPVGLLSGDEFLSQAEAFDHVLLEATGPRVALVLAADPRAAPRSARIGLDHYRGLGAEPFDAGVLDREGAMTVPFPECDVLFLAGGDPAALTGALHETPFWQEALAAWKRGEVALAGSSAGAMALCRSCLHPEPGARRPTVWSEGLGPLERFALAVHASSRPPEWLARVSRDAPVPVVAVDDATGILLRHGAAPRVAGPGKAWVIG